VDLVRHPKQEEPDDRFLLNKISRLWLCGVKIDWAGFYSAEKRHRISLPTYSFERLHYPIAGDPFKLGAEMLSKRPRLEKRKEITGWFYVPLWEKSILSSPKPVEASGQFNWLVFFDAHGLGPGLMKKLAPDEGQVIIVKAGTSFSRKNEREFTINPQQENDYDSLFNVLRQLKKIPHKILHLWSVTGNKERMPGFEGIDRVLESGYYSLLNIARAIGRQGITDDIQIGVVTDNMQEVTGEEELYPEKTTVLGAVKVISLEYPNIRCSSVDIVLPQPGSRKERKLLNNLAMEFTSSFSDKIIAYRGNFRWEQIIKPVQLDKPVEAKQLLREEGVYLITGGLGGIGLTLAKHLAKSVKARLILTGRSSFPAREKWKEWLSTHDDRDRIGLKIGKLLEIEKSGGKVLVIRADVTDPERMQEAIALTQERFGRINGVIHSAGTPDGGLIQGRTREMTEKVFDSKVRGTLILDRILKDEPLDFFVLCSSLASFLAPLGQVAYSAANAFLDAFAVYKTSIDESRFTTALNWDTWQEVGMAVESVKQLMGDAHTGKVEHPLLDRYVLINSAEIYIGHLGVKKNWILDDHRIFGKATLPGTTYVELIRAAFEKHAPSGIIQIKELYFLHPMVVEEDEEKEVRIILKNQEDHFEFFVISRSQSKGKWLEHARGKIAASMDEEPKKHNINEIEARCQNEQIDIKNENTLSGKGEELLKFGPRWDTSRKVKIGKNQGLNIVELPARFTGDLNLYKVHPALLDNALVGFFQEGAYYLPFSYRKIKIYGPLPRKVFSYIRFLDKPGTPTEFRNFKIAIMDEHGLEQMNIETYTLMAVSEERIQRREITGNQSGSDPLPGGGSGFVKKGSEVYRYTVELPGNLGMEIVKNGILPSEGVEVFHRVLSAALPQVVISTMNLAARQEQQADALKIPGSIDTPEFLEHPGPISTRKELSTRYVKPEKELEKRVVKIFRKFLGIEQIGIHDNFFELGANSLMLVQVNSLLQKELRQEISVATIYSHPTIKLLSEFLSKEDNRPGMSEEEVQRLKTQAEKGIDKLKQRKQRRTGMKNDS
jgi:NAD(P)-dependent dehydrogenase (short-subunit alcohol dehydrogenase family)/acyl carrier protein